MQAFSAMQMSLQQAYQEIERLREGLSAATSKISSLEEEKSILISQTESLSQENAALKRQMVETQPVSYDEDSQRLSLLSSAVVTSVERPGAFEYAVLTLPSDSSPDLKTPLILPTLRFRMAPDINGSEYFQQYIPYIREEVRAGMAKQIEKIGVQQLRPFAAHFSPEKTVEAGEFAVSLTCHTQELPRLDH